MSKRPTEESSNAEEIKRAKRQGRNKLQSAIASLRQEFNQRGSIFILNLPETTTKEDIITLFGKYGPIQVTRPLGELRIKMYHRDNVFTGECTVFYDTIVSAQQAIELADGLDFLGHKIKVEEAIHEKRELTDKKQESDKQSFGGTTASSTFGAPKVALTLEAKEKLALKKLALLATHLRIDNMFRAQELDKQLETDLIEDIKEECERLGVAEVAKVEIIGSLVFVELDTPESVTKVVSGISGRWFDGLRLEASPAVYPQEDKV